MIAETVSFLAPSISVTVYQQLKLKGIHVELWNGVVTAGFSAKVDFQIRIADNRNFSSCLSYGSNKSSETHFVCNS